MKARRKKGRCGGWFAGLSPAECDLTRYAKLGDTDFTKVSVKQTSNALSLPGDNNHKRTAHSEASDQHDVVLLLVVERLHLQEDRLADEVR